MLKNFSRKEACVCLCVFIYRRCGLLSYTAWKVQGRKRVKIQFLKRGGENNSTRLTFPSWWCRRQVPPKHWYWSTKSDGVTFQKTV